MAGRREPDCGPPHPAGESRTEPRVTICEAWDVPAGRPEDASSASHEPHAGRHPAIERGPTSPDCCHRRVSAVGRSRLAPTHSVSGPWTCCAAPSVPRRPLALRAAVPAGLKSSRPLSGPRGPFSAIRRRSQRVVEVMCPHGSARPSKAAAVEALAGRSSQCLGPALRRRSVTRHGGTLLEGGCGWRRPTERRGHPPPRPDRARRRRWPSCGLPIDKHHQLSIRGELVREPLGAGRSQK